MTPHMGKWYEQGDDAQKNLNPAVIPADWHEPVPVPFLAVKNAQFIFSIAARNSDNKPDDVKELANVFEALNNALLWLGAGAKTAAGYGYMSIDPDFVKEQAEAEQKQTEQKRLGSLSAEQKQIAGLRKNLQDKQHINAREQIGGLLYTDLKKLVDVAVHWSPSDQSDLQQLGVEILDFIDAKSNKKAKELLKRLDTNP